MTKIISFSPGHFERKKPRPLTSHMVTSLLAAYAKQKEHIPFGPTDIKGSFSVLISRGLIVRKEKITNDRDTLIWQVTPEAIDMLKALGVEVPC